MGNFVREQARDLPVAGEYDVIVAGSGPAGVSAAIQAGRHGAKVLLLEWNNTVGGISTSGLMSHFTGTVHSKFYTELLQAMADRNEGAQKGKIVPTIDPENLKSVYLDMAKFFLLQRGNADEPLYLSRLPDNAAPAYKGVPSVGSCQTGEQLHRGGFSRAVYPQQGEQLTLFYLKT